METLTSSSPQAPTCRRARMDVGADVCVDLSGSNNIRSQEPAPRRLLAAATMMTMDATLEPSAMPGSGSRTPDARGEEKAGMGKATARAAARCNLGRLASRRRPLDGAAAGIAVDTSDGAGGSHDAGDDDEDGAMRSPLAAGGAASAAAPACATRGVPSKVGPP
jgi:hypothetical protein